MKPFRWDVKKREQLGRLIEAEPKVIAPDFMAAIRQCAARVLAFAGDSNLVFVGRSPESIFDYLSGTLLETSWSERLCLANISIRFQSLKLIARDFPTALATTREHFRAIRLSPDAIIRCERPVALVDLVASGSTFKNTSELLLSWATAEKADLNALRKKIRFVGITWRTKNSPKTFRWQQHARWLNDFPSGCVKNVSIPGWFWEYLGNNQKKVGWSNHPERWADPDVAKPPRQSSNIEALNFAVSLFDQARTAKERGAFADELRRQPQMTESWFRDVVSQTRKG